jgi:hypothetical protein
MGLHGPFVPTNFLRLYNTNTTVRQTLHSRGHQSTGNECGGTFTARDSRGRYGRHGEGDSKFITDFRKFYANPVRPGLLYVLRGTNAREAQGKWRNSPSMNSWPSVISLPRQSTQSTASAMLLAVQAHAAVVQL